MIDYWDKELDNVQKVDTILSQGALNFQYNSIIIECLPIDFQLKITLELNLLNLRGKFTALLMKLQELDTLSGFYSMSSGSFEAEHLPVTRRALVIQKPKTEKLAKKTGDTKDDIVKKMQKRIKKFENIKPI